jgi:MYXO-CTERM domain-containing protein
MNKKLTSGVFAGTLMLAASLAFAPPAMADGEWQAPDVTLFFGADLFDNQGDKPGPTLNETISNHWYEGQCTYDSVTGQPNQECDPLRFGLAMYRAPGDGTGVCSESFVSLVEPQEDGGGELTLDGMDYKVSQLQSDAGDAYCIDTDQRTHGESLLDYRDHRFDNELGTNWPDRPQLNLTMVKRLPQTNTGTEDHVRESLLAADELYKGNGNQHLSMPSWVLLATDVNDDAALYGEMLAAAGGTGQCCYKPDNAGSCDPSDPAQQIDFDDHLAKTSGAGVIIHNETKLRLDISQDQYKCGGTGKIAGPGAMKSDNFSGIKCHLAGSSCDDAPDEPAYLWPVFSCIQLRPPNVPADQLSVEYCGDLTATDFTDDDNDGCVTLTPPPPVGPPNGGGIEFVDEQQNLFYVSDGDTSMCQSVGAGVSWTTINCPNLGELCDLDDASQCSLGQYQCVNDQQVCQRYTGNDSCDSGACGEESIHETGALPPNAQFAVDRSGSLNDDQWSAIEQIAKNLAVWSYQEPGCETDGTNCDKVRLGIHFWSGMNPDEGATEVPVISVDEDTTESDMETAFDGIEPFGGTDFHHGARLLRDESNLTDPQRSNVGVFVTDGIAENAYTTREAARIMCDIRSRSTAPITTYVVGFAGAEQNLNSMMAAAGGTGSCCYSDDGDCDTEPVYSPCEMYSYEQDNGSTIVETFENWLQANRPGDYNEWINLNTNIDSDSHTEDSYNTGSVADRLGMIDDVARWKLKQDEGWDPQALDCQNDPGDANSTDGTEFYKWVLCETKKTLSYPVRHRYNGNIAEDVSSWSDFEYVYTLNHDSTFVAHDYVCTGAKQADDEDDLETELQAILGGLECTYPLSLLSGMESAPEFTNATKIRLYMPSLGSVVRVPHTDDSDGQSSFVSELDTLGIDNHESYSNDGWSFANEGRTSVSLSGNLCNLTKGDTVDKVTTQVCRLCDPDLVGTPCNYVACTPDSPPASPDVGDTAFTSGGQKCAWTEYPCPQAPTETCTGWAKTSRCGAGTYACDQDGFAFCESNRSPLPEICNGIDDDCDGAVDDLSDNPDDWTDAQMSLNSSAGASSDELKGWYCVNRDVCHCPDGEADPIFGTSSDADELQTMVEGQNSYADDNPGEHCQCGEGITAEGAPALEPTRTWAPDKSTTGPQASCSAGGSSAPGGIGAVLVAALLGLCGWRRRR